MRGLLIILPAFLFLMACGNQKQPATEKTVTHDRPGLDDAALIADSITYPVTIYNFDPADTWTAQCLSKVQREKMVNDIFEAIYAGHLTVYHYYTDEVLSVDEIRALETQPDFSRNRVEEIQFVETWHFSPRLKQFEKKVHSIVIAYALYDEDGNRRGLKAAFRIKME